MRRPAMVLHARCLRISRWHLATTAHLPWPGELAIEEPEDPADDRAPGAWDADVAPRGSVPAAHDAPVMMPADAVTHTRAEVAACNRS